MPISRGARWRRLSEVPLSAVSVPKDDGAQAVPGCLYSCSFSFQVPDSEQKLMAQHQSEQMHLHVVA